MNESNELLWKIAVPFFAVMFTIIGIEILLIWVLDNFEAEIQWVLNRIPAVRRYRERLQIEHWKECYLRGDMYVTVTHTNPETGVVTQIENRLLPLGMEENPETGELISAEQKTAPAEEAVIEPAEEVSGVQSPPV